MEMATFRLISGTAAQRARLLSALQRRPITTLEARRELDVLHPAARIMELRKQGHRIERCWTFDVTERGRPHRVARYSLIPEDMPMQLCLAA